MYPKDEQADGCPDSRAHAVRREHHIPHPVPHDLDRLGLGAAVLPPALAAHARRGLAHGLPLLDQGIRADLRTRRRQRHHDELPVRHQLAGLHGTRRQHRRAAARLRGADGILPRSRLSRHHAVRPRPRRREGTPAGDLPRRLRHHAQRVLDPGAELVDADAHRLPHRGRRVLRAVMARDHLQPVVPVPLHAHAPRVGADGGVPRRRRRCVAAAARLRQHRHAEDAAHRADAGRAADPCCRSSSATCMA